MLKKDIEWEVKQLWMAVEYYERAREKTFSRKEADEFVKKIHKLNKRIKELQKNGY